MTHDSLTYNGVAMTKDKDQGRDAGGGCYERASIWSLQSPATGAHDMVASFGGNTSGVNFAVRSLTGVATSSALDITDAFNPNCAAISRANTIATTGSISIEYCANAGNMTPTAGQTEQGGGAYLIGLTAGSKTFSWSLDSGCGGSIWALAVYKPAATSVQPPRSMHQFRKRRNYAPTDREAKMFFDNQRKSHRVPDSEAQRYLINQREQLRRAA